MARRIKECNFCRDSIINNEMEAGEARAVLEWYPENGLFAFTLYGNDDCGEPVENDYSLTFEYCPMCGRKIGAE